jgi:hypothetical protein
MHAVHAFIDGVTALAWFDEMADVQSFYFLDTLKEVKTRTVEQWQRDMQCE